MCRHGHASDTHELIMNPFTMVINRYFAVMSFFAVHGPLMTDWIQFRLIEIWIIYSEEVRGIIHELMISRMGEIILLLIMLFNGVAYRKTSYFKTSLHATWVN